MKTFIIRGAFANQFELQNYEPLVKKFNLHLIASTKPITKTSLPTTNLWSPYDLPNFPYKLSIINRLMKDSHWLAGLESRVGGADLLHVAETYYAYTHQAVMLKKKGRIKHLVSTCWETIPHNNEKIRGRKKWIRDAIKHIDIFITPTIRAKKTLIQQGSEPCKIKVIPMGVDLKRFKYHTPRKVAKNILFIGRFNREKGIHPLLNAYSQLDPGIKLTLIGSGPINPKELNNKVKVKQVPYGKIHAEYALADIFILPSITTPTWEEQYGMVLVEAMASGLPIITTNSGAIPEVVGDAAIVCKENNSRCLKDNLEKLIKDPALRLQLSKKAGKRAKSNYDREITAKALAKVYNDLICTSQQ